MIDCFTLPSEIDVRRVYIESKGMTEVLFIYIKLRYVISEIIRMFKRKGWLYVEVELIFLFASISCAVLDLQILYKKEYRDCDIQTFVVSIFIIDW